jgi:hypothetical protein
LIGDSVGTWAMLATRKAVGSLAPAMLGSSVRTEDSLVPLPSASKKMVPSALHIPRDAARRQ